MYKCIEKEKYVQKIKIFIYIIYIYYKYEKIKKKTNIYSIKSTL